MFPWVYAVIWCAGAGAMWAVLRRLVEAEVEPIRALLGGDERYELSIVLSVIWPVTAAVSIAAGVALRLWRCIDVILETVGRCMEYLNKTPNERQLDRLRRSVERSADKNRRAIRESNARLERVRLEETEITDHLKTAELLAANEEAERTVEGRIADILDGSSAVST